MDQYTDDERVEDLKKWWKENGTSVFIGIALGLIVIFGWQYWNSHRNTQAEKASEFYSRFVEAAEKPDAEQARQRGQQLLTEFPNSPYAVLAALRLAKLAMDSGDTTTAAQWLEWVIANAKFDEIQDIARLRLARVLFATGQPAGSEKLLERMTTAGLTAEREELKGDLYLAGNDRAKAKAAYAAAQAAGGGSPLLQIKLDNLTTPTAESVVAAPTEPPAPAAAVQTEPPAPAAAVQTEPPAPAAAIPTEPPAPAAAIPTEPPAPAADNQAIPAPAALAPTSGQ